MTFNIVSRQGVLQAADDGTPLANFGLGCVQPLYSPADLQKIEGIQVEILHTGACRSICLDLQASDLMGQICSKIPTCRILQPRLRGHMDAYLIDQANAARSSGVPTLYFRKHGLYRLWTGCWAYVCGDTVLGLPQGYESKIAEDVACAHLAWREDEPAPSATQKFCQRLQTCDHILLPVWGFTILASLHSCIRQLDLTTFPSLAIIGGQNLGKTTLAQRYALLYDDTGNPGRYWGQLDAHSTAAATIDLVSRYRDQAVLVDDLAKSDAAAEQRARLNLISEVLRFAANDVSRMRISSQKQLDERFCQAGLVFSGEFHMRNPSDLTRLIVIYLTAPMSGGHADDRALAATVFHYFVLWLLPHLDEELAEADHILQAAPSGNFIRLQKNYAILLWAIRLFYRFAADIGAVSENYYAGATARAKDILNKLLNAQSHAISQSTLPAPRGNLSWYIVDGYHKGKFSVAAQRKLLGEYDCIVEKDALCIRSESLHHFFVTHTPYCGLSKTEMNRRLIAEGALLKGRENRSAKKKIHGRRYLELSFAALKKAALMY